MPFIIGMKKTIRINLFGAPGSGKSVIAALLFAELKIREHTAELIREVAKEMIYEGIDIGSDEIQIDIFNTQKHKEDIVISQTDFLITDSPLLLNAFYSGDESILKIAKKKNSKIKNINYWITRSFFFESEGRRHDQNESDRIDNKMKRFLTNHGIDFTEIDGESSKIKVEKMLLDLRAKKYIK